MTLEIKGDRAMGNIKFALSMNRMNDPVNTGSLTGINNKIMASIKHVMEESSIINKGSECKVKVDASHVPGGFHEQLDGNYSLIDTSGKERLGGIFMASFKDFSFGGTAKMDKLLINVDYDEWKSMEECC